jgi:hypothetical protein
MDRPRPKNEPLLVLKISKILEIFEPKAVLIQA